MQTSTGVHLVSVKWVSAAFTRRINRPEREADYSVPSIYQAVNILFNSGKINYLAWRLSDKICGPHDMIFRTEFSVQGPAASGVTVVDSPVT